MDQLELLKRQYLQLLDPELLSLPPADVIRLPHVQAQIYETMFRDGCLPFPPPDRYRLRVLKVLVQRMEAAIADPEEDEISDDLTACLSNLMSQSQIPAAVAAQQKQHVTYTLPELTLGSRTITTLEARAILASSGTTGLRTWEAALHLGTFLSSPEGLSLVKNKNVLELGAGTGFVSMLCAKNLGARYVLATDGSGEVVEDMKANIYLNGLEGSALIDTTALKWGHALIDGFFDDGEAGPRFDIVLGADVTYDQRSILPLVSTLKDLFLKYPDIQAMITATVRNEDTLKSFEEACEACNRLDKGVGEAEGLSTGRDPTAGPSRNPGRRSGGKTQRNDRKPVHQSELPLKLNMAIMMRLRDQAVARAMAAFKPTRATMRPIAVHVEEDQLSPTQTRGRANLEDAGLRAMTRKKTMCPRGGRNPKGNTALMPEIGTITLLVVDENVYGGSQKPKERSDLFGPGSEEENHEPGCRAWKRARKLEGRQDRVVRKGGKKGWQRFRQRLRL